MQKISFNFILKYVLVELFIKILFSDFSYSSYLQKKSSFSVCLSCFASVIKL